MYAIVKIGSKQFKVNEGAEIICDRLALEPGEEFNVDKVLMLVDNKKVVHGEALESCTVRAQVIEHVKGDKILVFKYKPKKGYRRLHGHRQALSKVKILTIKTAEKQSKTRAKTKEEVAAKSGGEK